MAGGANWLYLDTTKVTSRLRSEDDGKCGHALKLWVLNRIAVRESFDGIRSTALERGMTAKAMLR